MKSARDFLISVNYFFFFLKQQKRKKKEEKKFTKHIKARVTKNELKTILKTVCILSTVFIFFLILLVIKKKKPFTIKYTAIWK